jgi:hypothetical protein
MIPSPLSMAQFFKRNGSPARRACLSRIAGRKMKDALPFIPSKKAVNVFFAIYTGAFLLGLLGFLLLPKEEATLRKVALGMSYFLVLRGF